MVLAKSSCSLSLAHQNHQSHVLVPEQMAVAKGVGDTDHPDVARLLTPGLGVECQVGVAPVGRGLRS